MNPLTQKIGIIGGGQLGKMMILDAKRLGLEFVVLDPAESCPAHSISDHHIVKSFMDEEAYRELASEVDVITYEFEHINAHILETLEKEGTKVYPSASSLKIIQNKLTQKETLVKAGIATPDFMAVNSLEDIYSAGEKWSYPMMLKACTGGYDGKGNALVKNREKAEEAFQSLGSGSIPLMVERFCPFVKEVSVLACRGIDGSITVYPVAENIHKESILDETIIPADISPDSTEKAMTMAHRVMEIFADVGMFCTEMFVTAEGEIYLNEVAPRPHNSGHYTIEGCLTSQFEQHIRAIAGLPLGDVSLRTPIVMRNLLGEGEPGATAVAGLTEALSDPSVKVHIYGKKESRNKRKMGHLTAVASSAEKAQKAAERAYKALRIFGE